MNLDAAVLWLPTINAVLNSLATVLLAAGSDPARASNTGWMPEQLAEDHSGIVEQLAVARASRRAARNSGGGDAWRNMTRLDASSITSIALSGS
jgi:hypothetical protein